MTKTRMSFLKGESGFPRGSGGGPFSPLGSGFLQDLEVRTMTSLQWKEGMSQRLPEPEVGGEAPPIYALARRGVNLFVGDEAGFLHLLPGWFDPANSRRDLGERPQVVRSLHVSEKAALTCVQPLKGGKVLLGTGQGNACLLDYEEGSLVHTFERHGKGVKRVDCWGGCDVVVTCGKDNKIKVFDTRVQVKGGDPVNILNDVHESVVSTPAGKGKRGRAAVTKSADAGSASSCVADFVFLDEFRILSAGSSDGRLKVWDLRCSYKQMKKCYPVDVVEFPSQTNVKGYSCLKVGGNKVYASGVGFEAFCWDLAGFRHEATFISPSKFSNFTKIDLTEDGKFLAVGSDSASVHIYSTTDSAQRKGEEARRIEPCKNLNHEAISGQMSVCCPVFGEDNYMITTGGDAAVLSKWLPEIYTTSSKELEKEARKKEIEAGPQPVLKTEFRIIKKSPVLLPIHPMLASPSRKSSFSNNKENFYGKISLWKKLDLDSFPNYIVDGMKLPHIYPKIRIRLKPKISSPLCWNLSPDVKPGALKVQSPSEETTPKRRGTGRKRKRFMEENSSPKILQYFPVTSSPSMRNTDGNESDALASPIAALAINPLQKGGPKKG